MKGLSLDWAEDNQLHDSFKAWKKRIEMLTIDMALKKEPEEFICHCIKAWAGEMGQVHIEAVGLTNGNGTAQNVHWTPSKVITNQEVTK